MFITGLTPSVLRAGIAAIIIVFALCIRFFGGNVYRRLSIIYHERFDDITTASEVLDAQNNISNSSSNYTSRMTYIPGLRYEYSEIQILNTFL